jgi:hypothetical protein
MKHHPWTLALAAAGVVSLAPTIQAEEAPPAVLTAVSSTTLSGYVDTSAIWKFGTDRGGSVLPGRSYDGPSKQDGFNLNVAKLALGKPLEEDKGGWSAGYQVELLFGPDANVYASTSTGSEFATSDFAIKQVYVSLRAPVGNGLDFKVGFWDACIGYEVFDAAGNPNYSRSYGYFIEPLSHTGIQANYKVNEIVSLTAGVADAEAVGTGISSSINSRSNLESVKSYMGMVNITAPESMGFLKGSSVTAGVVDSGATLPGEPDVVNYYVGGTFNTPVSGLSLGAAYDYRGNKQGGEVGPAYANAVSLYTLYQASEKLKVAVRGEYASASAGTFESSTGADPVRAKPVGGPNNEEFLALTATADYSLWANVVSRLEFRWDHDASGGPPAFGSLGTTGTPNALGRFSDANYLRNAFSLALSIIYKF